MQKGELPGIPTGDIQNFDKTAEAVLEEARRSGCFAAGRRRVRRWCRLPLDSLCAGCYNAKSKKSYTNPTERSEYMGRNDRYFMSSVKIGPKGQIVIPKEARDMFGLEPGDTLVLMADKKKGLALQTVDKLNPLMKTVFNSLPSEDGEVDDE